MTAPILFVHNHLARFVQIDRDLLRERWPVREWYQRGRLINLPALAQAVRQSRLVFAWFASWHSLWPLLLARTMDRPSILVVGGYDVANCPEIGYGSQRAGLRRLVSRAAVHSATMVLTFSAASRNEIAHNLGMPIEHVHLVHLGVPDSLGALPAGERQSLALTVGNVDRDNVRRKGHEAFILAAAHLPQVSFVLAGAWHDEAAKRLRDRAPANARLTGWLSAPELEAYYCRAGCYVQASAHEGFGLAVAEAMLAGCIPVVTRAGALPEVVGDCGVYMPAAEPQDIAEGVRNALAMPASARLQARNHVLCAFPMDRRRQGLFGLVESQLNGRSAH